MTVNFLSETMTARKKWHNIFFSDERQELTNENLIPSETSFKNEREIKMLSGEEKLKRIC